MKARLLIALALILVLALFLSATSTAAARREVKQLSTDLDRFGGRPGSFHFVTNEQAMKDEAELIAALDAIEAIRAEAARLPEKQRTAIMAQLATVQQFAQHADGYSTRTMGDSAAQIEARLNDAKGNYMCGACHGPGAMHNMMHGQ